MISNEELMECLKKLGIQAEKNAKDNKREADKNTKELKRDVTKKIEDLEKKVDSAMNEAIEKEARDEVKLKAMNKRLEDIENKIKSQNDKWEMRLKEKEEQKDRVKYFNEAVGLNIETEESPKKTKTWTELIEENKEKEKQRREAAKKEEVKHWHKQIKIREKVTEIEAGGDLNSGARKSKIATKEDTKKELELKLDTSESPNEDDWSWDECDRDWDGTEGRKEDEKRKKILRYRKKKMFQAKTARRAKHMIGLGPILRQSVNYFTNITSDPEEARKMAVNEYLTTYLQYTEDELEYINIVDTMNAKSDDEVIYVTFREHSTIKDIYSRAAEIRNDDISTRIFVPPQFWQRYQYLSQHCAEMRSRNKDLKTQLRFGDEDLEILVKDRAKDDGYSQLSLKDLETNESIPKFNHEIPWKKRIERGTRNSLKSVSGKLIPPSVQRTSVSRSSSSGSDFQPTKRHRKNNEENMDTSGGEAATAVVNDNTK